MSSNCSVALFSFRGVSLLFCIPTINIRDEALHFSHLRSSIANKPLFGRICVVFFQACGGVG